MPRVLFFLQSAFSLWMVVDAIRRGAAYYWYPVILLPFGEWVYFFMVKIHDPEFDWARELHCKLTTKKVTVEDLRYREEESPSFASKTALAQALYDEGTYDQGNYREAAELFAAALQLHDDSREALYGLALCHGALREHDAAIEGFRQLIELDPSFRDYAAYTDLAHILAESGRLEETLALLGGLVEKSPRLRHRVAYAHYLMHAGRSRDAHGQLTAGLHEYDQAPKYVQRKQRAWAKRAKQMLTQAEREGPRR